MPFNNEKFSDLLDVMKNGLFSNNKYEAPPLRSLGEGYRMAADGRYRAAANGDSRTPDIGESEVK